MNRAPVTAAIVSLALAASLAAPVRADESEVLRYSWKLGGFVGTFARLFLPGRGEGTLTTRQAPSGELQVELDITASSAEEGEYWRYGSAIDPADQRTLRAWSSYRFRGEEKSERSELGEEEVIDTASGIILLRRERPTQDRKLRIWNDGKLYPVVIQPRGTVQRTVNGRPYLASHYAIRARKVPGERLWKGKLDLYLANDDRATPIEIALERRMATVRLEIEP